VQYDNAKQQSEISDRLLLKNNKDYLNMVMASENSFKLYHDNLILNQQKYTEGVSNIDTYLKAFQDYLTAENTYLNNLSQLLSVKATILSRQ
jgi:outer membrane protein